MSFRSLLNDVCTIYERVESTDSVTGEQIFTNRVLAQNVPCALQHSGGSIDRDARLVKGDNTDRLYLFPSSVTISKTETVVEVRGNKYSVREITDLGGRKRYLRVDLELIQLEGVDDESESQY